MSKLLASEILEIDEAFLQDLTQRIIDRIESNLINKTYSVDEVAKKVNKDAQTVRRHIRKGLLKAKKTGKPYLITHENLVNYIENN